MKNILLKTVAFIICMPSFIAFSQDATLKAVVNEDGAIMISVSDNGMWAAGYTSDGGEHLNASVWNLETLERMNLISFGDRGGAYDVSDDGTIVVGSFNDAPGYWEEGVWNDLPLPIENGIGRVFSVSPDGEQMVGRVFTSDWSASHACHWVNGELVEVNHSELDKAGYNAYFNELIDVSADGNTVLGCLNYIVLPDRTAFIMVDGEYIMFGDEYYDPLNGGEGQYIFYDNMSLSPNGKWVTGDIYWVEQNFSDEYYCPFRYDVENDVTELFLNDVVVASFASDNQGNIYGAVPINYPIRDAMFLKNGNWVLFDDEVSNEYGINIYEETGYDKLGMIFSVSADGKTIIGSKEISTYSWVLKIEDHGVGVSQIDSEEILRASLHGNKIVLEGKTNSVALYNMSGSKVMEKNTRRLPIVDVSGLSDGLYLVVITDIYGNEKTEKIRIVR